MDASAGSVAYLGGIEVLNEGRTNAYLRAGYGPPSLVVAGGCTCPDIFKLAGCEDSPGQTAYVSPEADPAPWYDPSVPESADFAGFYPTSFEGFGATYTRTRQKRINGGSVLGRRLAEERIITWRGYLFGRTCCAVQYGLRWLIARLSGTGCDCEAEEMDILVCCPSVTGDIKQCDASVLPSVRFSDPCSGLPGGSAFDAFRTLRNVALIEGPTILSERKTGGCQSGCKHTDDPNTIVDESIRCVAESCIIEVEFSLVAGTPFLYGCPITVCNKQSFAPGGTPPCPPGGTLIGVGPRQTIEIKTDDSICALTECPVITTEVIDPFCPTPNLPVFTQVDTNACGDCDPLDPITQCCYVANDNFGTFFEGTAIIEIFAGSSGMRNTHIRFLNNPLERPCNEIDGPCNECDSLHVRYIPPEGTLVIDGLNQTVRLKRPGDQEGSNADSLIVSPFSWSVLQCIDTCICITTDGHLGKDKALDVDRAYFSVSIVPSQM